MRGWVRAAILLAPLALAVACGEPPEDGTIPANGPPITEHAQRPRHDELDRARGRVADTGADDWLADG